MRLADDRASAPREFVPADLPAAVVRAAEALVRRRQEVREAHLVAMRAPRTARPVSTLVLVTDDPTSSASLAQDLRQMLQPHVRPGIVVLPDGSDELVAVRGLGGELKRSERRWPWWLLFLGI